MGKSSGDSPGLAAAGAIKRARLIRKLKLDQTRLKSLNQELRAACDQLQNSLQHCSDLYDYAPVGYVVFDGTGSIQEINLAGAELLGAKLDGHYRVEARVAGPVHLTHATGADGREDLVGTEPGACR